jgi:hypothetical protein
MMVDAIYNVFVVWTAEIVIRRGEKEARPRRNPDQFVLK